MRILRKNVANTFNIRKEEIPILQVVIHYHEHKECERGKLDKDEILQLIKNIMHQQTA